jgi:hypothetical protein
VAAGLVFADPDTVACCRFDIAVSSRASFARTLAAQQLTPSRGLSGCPPHHRRLLVGQSRAVSADHVADWMAARFAGKPMSNERWYVDNSGAVTKTAL